MFALPLLLACTEPTTPSPPGTADTASPYTDGGSPDGGSPDGGSGDGGADGCPVDDTLVPSASLAHLSLVDTRGDREGEAWFPMVELPGIGADFDGTARVCRDLRDGTSACTAALPATGPDLRIPSTLLAPGSRFHVELDDGTATRCSTSVAASIDALDYEGAGLQRTEELAWSAPPDLDIPPTLLGVAIHGVDAVGGLTMTVVGSVSSTEGLQQTALVRFVTGGTDAVQPLADGTGFSLLDQDGILALRLSSAGAVLEEWEMIPADQRCPNNGELRRGAPAPDAPPALGNCAMLSHGMVVDAIGTDNIVLSVTPVRCEEDPSQVCLIHDISRLSAGALTPLWAYEDHVDEVGDRKLDADIPYLNGVGRDGDLTCASWFSIDFDADRSLPAVVCVGVSDARTVFDLDPTVTHVPHDADPMTLPDGRTVVVIADNTNGDVDSTGHRKPPRIQLYELPVGATAPDAHLTAIASFDTDIDEADNYRFGSVAPRINTDGQLVTVYVDGSGTHEVGHIDLGTGTYTALARQALRATEESSTSELPVGARKLGAYALSVRVDP
ncbi:MAG: hypothetical protein D6798_01760 [Deltaproteobacteria bacterium]|nr:MAG: hypothetical protein D6798_01760 [Deltaproteobacteria bacterium]